jgi:hypothetical protein
MRVPNVSERMKEAPAHALRAVFAGIGQALLLSDRVRRRFRDGEQEPQAPQPVTGPPPAAAGPPAPAESAAPATPTAKPAPAAKPAPTAKPAPAPSGPAPAPSGPAAPPTGPAAAPSAAERGTESRTAPVTEPPFPNYDQLSIASLRARMRGLDVSQLRNLINYEKAHAARDDVIAMFERRITKLEETGG